MTTLGFVLGVMGILIIIIVILISKSQKSTEKLKLRNKKRHELINFCLFSGTEISHFTFNAN